MNPTVEQWVARVAPELAPVRVRELPDKAALDVFAMLAGRRKLVVFYERDGIVYRKEKQDRNFELASRIEFDTPVAGVLERIHGRCAKVLLLGCVRVRSMVRDGETVEVRVGTFTSEPPLTPIKARGPARPTRPRTE